MKADIWIQKNIHYVFLIILTLFILLAVSAPVCMKLGFENLAKIIYWIYSHFCHQFAYRSWFLFGEQSSYPLVQQSSLNQLTFQDAFGDEEPSSEFARSIIGNDRFGYKMAFCQRDLAMYGSLLLFGMFYIITKMRVKRIPLIIWVSLGLLPLAIDGSVQFLGSISEFPIGIRSWESLPIIRTITGILFGFFTGWYIFPSIRMTASSQMIDRRKDI